MRKLTTGGGAAVVGLSSTELSKEGEEIKTHPKRRGSRRGVCVRAHQRTRERERMRYGVASRVVVAGAPASFEEGEENIASLLRFSSFFSRKRGERERGS